MIEVVSTMIMSILSESCGNLVRFVHLLINPILDLLWKGMERRGRLGGSRHLRGAWLVASAKGTQHTTITEVEPWSSTTASNSGGSVLIFSCWNY